MNKKFKSMPNAECEMFALIILKIEYTYDLNSDLFTGTESTSDDAIELIYQLTCD